MSAREAYIAGRSGGSRPPKQTSPSSTQGNRQQEREQQAYDAGRQERERAQTIQQQGITGLPQDQREQARSIAEQTGKDPYDTESQIAPGGEIIEKQDSTFLKDIFTANEIQRLDANQLARAQQIINQFRPLNLNPFQLRNVMIANLFGGVFQKDQTYTDSEGKVIDPDDVKTISGAAGMPTLVGPEGQDVRLSREGVLDLLGSDTYKSLEKFAPDLIFGTDIGVTPATSGGLLNLADNPTATKNQDGTYTTADGRIISKEQGERYNNAVFAARDELNRMDRNPFTGTKNVSTSSPAFAPPTAPASGIPAPQPPTYPGFPVTPTPTPPGTPTTPVATNYSNLPTYTQLGIPTFLGDPRFAQFRDTLNLFPRV
tara:strand:- start:20 stop:1135 length:1116 start_codon:yes stop_codon:yes gene_type:complete